MGKSLSRGGNPDLTATFGWPARRRRGRVGLTGTAGIWDAREAGGMQAPGRRPFRFGIINESFGSPAEWTERARRAEALGYATFLIRDHLVSDYFGDQFAPLPALTAAAAATTALRVGTLVLDNDFRHPAMLAK